jgi:hypothetical protein
MSYELCHPAGSHPLGEIADAADRLNYHHKKGSAFGSISARKSPLCGDLEGLGFLKTLRRKES